MGLESAFDIFQAIALGMPADLSQPHDPFTVAVKCRHDGEKSTAFSALAPVLDVTTKVAPGPDRSPVEPVGPALRTQVAWKLAEGARPSVVTDHVSFSRAPTVTAFRVRPRRGDP
jgi:hypothetical protein